MKKLFYVFLSSAFILLLSNNSFAQIRKIPAEVTSSFTEKYPQAELVEWRDKLTGFTASFSVDSIDYLASFSNKGEWESTEIGIEQSDLPEVVQDGFEKSKYADWTVNEIRKIELPDDVLQYTIQVERSDINKRNLYFSSKGRMLRDKITL
jgi:hypothetical protein